MIITQTIIDLTYEQAVAARNHAARALYQAELALHDAHQTRVDQWIAAAQDRLHVAENPSNREQSSDDMAHPADRLVDTINAATAAPAR